MLILGGSVRAAAFSALRAGFLPQCGDQFGDADLRAVCRVELATHYPRDLLAIAESTPAMTWLYTGALENHPRIVERVSQTHRLLGVDGAALPRVRDPWRLEAMVHQAGATMPAMRPSPGGLPTDGAWLVKRARSAGGLHIRPWLGETTPRATRGRVYWQQRVVGVPLGLTYIAAGGRSRLIGACESLADEGSFHYAGSIGPVALSAATLQTAQRLGTVIAEAFDLVGLFGIDVIATNDHLTVLEVNPRYTASVEVLERALNTPLMMWHVNACERGELPEEPLSCAARWHGKRVVYAQSRRSFDTPLVERLLGGNRDPLEPVIADIPSPATIVEPGQPMLTVFAEASTREELLARLATIAAEWEQIPHHSANRH